MKILCDTFLISGDEKVRVRLDAIKAVEVQGTDVVIYLDREWYFRIDSSAVAGRAEADARWIVEQIGLLKTGNLVNTFR